MSYVPTQWKTGDIVTAEKLNNLENGAADKGYEIEELISDVFSDSIVAEESEWESSVFIASIDLKEDLPAMPDELIVIYDNVEYVAEQMTIDGGNYYGANMDESGMPDFSEYPFCCFISPNNMSSIELVTETAGSHFMNIKSVQKTFVASSDFSNAVNQVVDKNVIDVLMTYDGIKIVSASNSPESIYNILGEGKNVRIVIHEGFHDYTVFYLQGYHTGTIGSMNTVGHRFYSLPTVENGEIVAGDWIDVAQVTTKSGYSYHYILDDNVSSAYPII